MSGSSHCAEGLGPCGLCGPCRRAARTAHAAPVGCLARVRVALVAVAWGGPQGALGGPCEALEGRFGGFEGPCMDVGAFGVPLGTLRLVGP